MRFSIAFVAGFVAMASAASTTTATLNASQASQLACLDNCDAGDVDCQSHCITVPSPNKAQANKTNECVSNCDQGSGSKADTEAYSKCVQACIADNYYEPTSGTPEQTGSSNSNSKDSSKSGDSTATATAASSGSDSTDASKTDSSDSSSTGTSTGSSSSSTSSDSAAANILVGSVSLLGLFAAVLAL